VPLSSTSGVIALEAINAEMFKIFIRAMDAETNGHIYFAHATHYFVLKMDNSARFTMFFRSLNPDCLVKAKCRALLIFLVFPSIEYFQSGSLFLFI